MYSGNEQRLEITYKMGRVMDAQEDQPGYEGWGGGTQTMENILATLYPNLEIESQQHGPKSNNDARRLIDLREGGGPISLLGTAHLDALDTGKGGDAEDYPVEIAEEDLVVPNPCTCERKECHHESHGQFDKSPICASNG
jgi:hypothetical protein